jgi:hypothetical protein
MASVKPLMASFISAEIGWQGSLFLKGDFLMKRINKSVLVTLTTLSLGLITSCGALEGRRVQGRELNLHFNHDHSTGTTRVAATFGESVCKTGASDGCQMHSRIEDSLLINGESLSSYDDLQGVPVPSSHGTFQLKFKTKEGETFERNFQAPEFCTMPACLVATSVDVYPGQPEQAFMIQSDSQRLAELGTLFSYDSIVAQAIYVNLELAGLDGSKLSKSLGAWNGEVPTELVTEKLIRDFAVEDRKVPPTGSARICYRSVYTGQASGVRTYITFSGCFGSTEYQYTKKPSDNRAIVMFATSGRHSGNFARPFEAQEFCQAEGDRLGFRTRLGWRPVLWDNYHTNVYPNESRFLNTKIVNLNGQVIKAVGQNFSTPTNLVDADGQSVVQSDYWTGYSYGDNCENWKSDSSNQFGKVGFLSQTRSCNEQLKLLCMSL